MILSSSLARVDLAPPLRRLFIEFVQKQYDVSCTRLAPALCAYLPADGAQRVFAADAALMSWNSIGSCRMAMQTGHAGALRV